MTNVSHGMNVTEVEALGQRLQTNYAEGVRSLVREVENIVGSTSTKWVGADADRFRSWWPEKKSKMLAMADDLHGFGQSALNNASEQRTASGEGPAGGGGFIPLPGWLMNPGQPDLVPTGGDRIAPFDGKLPGSDRSVAEVAAAYKENYIDYGLRAQGADGGEYEYQCVSWAWFRMRELGFNGEQLYGNGKDVAGALGGTTSTVPEPGAVLSWDYGDAYGHVVIAEEVTQNADGSLSVRVSEMNTGSDGSDANDGNPEEYKAERVLTRNSDGSWVDGGVVRTVTTANPEYGQPRI